MSRELNMKFYYAFQHAHVVHYHKNQSDAKVQLANFAFIPSIIIIVPCTFVSKSSCVGVVVLFCFIQN